ncbi:hypothetical protein Tco_0311884 [Tanacetum coccineum]
MDDPIKCMNLMDHVPLSGYWASLRNLSDADFLDRVNLSSTQHVYMVFELRLRYEHEITVREKFKKKFTDSSEVIQRKDAKIVELRSKLEKADGEAADVVEVRRKVSELEDAATARTEELVGHSVQNAELLGLVSGLESVRDSLKEKVTQPETECGNLQGHVEGEAKLKGRFMAVHDDAVRCLADLSSALDARLFELSYQVDSELCPHMLTAVVGRRWVIGHGLRLAFMKCCWSVEYQTAIGNVVSLAIDQGIQQGLEAGIDHGKAGRDLSMVEAYDPGVQARYEEAVKELEDISLPFLAHLKSYKDAPLERAMAFLCRGREGGSRVLGTVCRTSTSHATVGTPLNSITVEDYTILDVSMLRPVTEFGPPNLSSVDNHHKPVHDGMFDMTLMDKPADP